MLRDHEDIEAYFGKAGVYGLLGEYQKSIDYCTKVI